MTNIDFDKYRKILENDKLRLEKALEKIAFRDDHNPNDWVPRRENLNISDGEAVESVELAEEIEEYENNTAIVKELESRWNEIRVALKRIDEGTYGIDEVSGEPISEARLDANPAARTSTVNAPLVEREAKTENELD